MDDVYTLAYTSKAHIREKKELLYHVIYICNLSLLVVVVERERGEQFSTSLFLNEVFTNNCIFVILNMLFFLDLNLDTYVTLLLMPKIVFIPSV